MLSDRDLYCGEPMLCRWCGEDYGQHGCCGDEDRPCELESYDEAQERMELNAPCTADAIRHGCTCRMSSVNSASIDPPEPIINRDCPLHGSDCPYDRLEERAA